MHNKALPGTGRGWAEHEGVVLGAIILAVWAYIIARAILVPFIQDEGNSFWMYAHTGEFLPFRSHTDAGNHFLNSFFGAIGYHVWGFSPLGIRWGSVLSFPLYASGCWAISRNFPALLRWCAFLALVLCPFLLDFFALFRGYGPAMACWIWALHGLTAYARHGRIRDVVLMSLAAAFSLMADLSLLPANAILLVLAVLLLVIRHSEQRPSNRAVGILALLLLALVLAYGALIALDLRSKGLLYHGGGQGLMHVTVRSLAYAVFNQGSNSFIYALVVPLFIGLGVAGRELLRTRDWRSPFIMLVTVLVLDVLSRWAMAWFMGTNYPQDRAALHFIPLYILIVAHSVDVLGKHSSVWSYAALLLLFFPARTLQTLNFDRMVDWYEKTFPLRFISEVEVLRKQLGRPLLLSGSEHYAPACAFHQAAEDHPPIDMRTDMHKNDPDDVRIINRESLDAFSDGYHIADSSSSGAYLLVRNKPCIWTLRADTTLPSVTSEEEWIYLPIVCPQNSEGMGLLFEAEVQTEDTVSHIMLVTEVHDSSGAYIRYDAVDLRNWRHLTSGTRIEAALFVQAIPAGGTCSFYLWNMRRTRYHLSETYIQTLDISCP